MQSARFEVSLLRFAIRSTVETGTFVPLCLGEKRASWIPHGLRRSGAGLCPPSPAAPLPRARPAAGSSTGASPLVGFLTPSRIPLGAGTPFPA